MALSAIIKVKQPLSNRQGENRTVWEMNRRGRSRFGGSPEIYYYNSARRDAVGELAGQLSGLIQEEMTRRHKKKLVFLCIGTDRSHFI